MNTARPPLEAREVALRFKCSTGYIYKLARSGKLGYLALGEDGPGHRTAMRFPVEEVEAFLRARLVPARRTSVGQRSGQS